jgi:hypothetical protein
VLLPWTEALESVDTTRVIEELALGEGLRRLESGDVEGARRLAGARLRSSWWTTLHAPEGETTAARWRAIDALARLGIALSDDVPSFGALADVVDWYESTGWIVDDGHRKTELLRVTAGFAHNELDDLFQDARQPYESWLDQVLRATTDALDQPDVTSSRLLRTVHHHDVRNGPTPTAYVLVDALRYELGVDLVERLRSTNARADIRSVVAAVPTITPVGMAAVLPGADTGFAIELDAKERLEISIGGIPVRSVRDRVQVLEHAHGKVTDLKLDDVAQFANKELRKKIEGASLVLVRSTGHEVWVDVPEQPEEIDPLAEDEAAATDPRSAGSAADDGAPQGASVAELIARGEGARVEFKQTARVNLSTKQRDQVIELMVAKSIAGFMNAHGGTLLIGVTDRGEVFGLQKDLKTLGSKQNRDGFELWLTGMLDNMLGPTATSQVSISYEDFPEGSVCRIDVGSSKRPTFVKGGKGEADLYVRLNNSTRLLNTADAVEYVSSHWR